MGAAILHPFPLLVCALDVEFLALVQLPNDFFDIIPTLQLFHLAEVLHSSDSILTSEEGEIGGSGCCAIV